MNAAVITRSLTKTFGGRNALNSVDVRIPGGHVVGLLGRNGAGKTTLMQVICGLVLPTAGSCSTLGVESRDLDEDRLARIGLVHQEASHLGWMTVADHLAFTASFYPGWDPDRQRELLRGLELNPRDKVGALSTGDRQKLGVIQAICHHPDLLLLDEPMSGLDPIVRARMLDLILALVRDDACTIVISSHALVDVERIVDWVVCLDRGELAASAPLDELQESFASRAGRPMNLEEIFPSLIRERRLAS